MKKFSPAKQIERHIKLWNGCRRCNLGCVTDFRIYYRGDVPCDILIIGEAPGDVEITCGEPFVGPAGQELDRWIEHVKLKGETFPRICFTNAVICPPKDSPERKNRAPKATEISACTPRLAEFYRIVQPTVLVAAGKPAEQAVKKLFIALDSDDVVECIRIPHPSYVLQQQERGGVDRARGIEGLTRAFQCCER